MATIDGRPVRPKGFYGPSFSDLHPMAGKRACANCGRKATLVIQCSTDRVASSYNSCALEECKNAVAALTRRSADAFDLRVAIERGMKAHGLTPVRLARKSSVPLAEVKMVLKGDLTLSTNRSLGLLCKKVGLMFFGLR